jgi:Cytosolic domain of 10TM putative phosphate transporter
MQYVHQLFQGLYLISHLIARFVLLHTFTTVPILLPIHIQFSDGSISQRSMTRASVSSLVGTTEGTRLLWIHVVLLCYVTLSWIAALIWICRRAFHYRQAQIHRVAERCASASSAQNGSQHHPHPHSRCLFQSLPEINDDQSNRGLRLRTVMVTNVPLNLRSEKELADYFEYYLSRPSAIPSLSLRGLFNKLAEVVYQRVIRVLEHMHQLRRSELPGELESDTSKLPAISRVIICRKMTALASLLERREKVLRSLEAAHVKLAERVLNAVKKELDKCEGSHLPETRGSSLFKRREDELEKMSLDMIVDDEKVKEQLIRTLQPFVDEFGLRSGSTEDSKVFSVLSIFALILCFPEHRGHIGENYETVWEALHALPRSALNGYQPLIHLSLFRGHTAPEIDYFTAKFNLLTSYITEERARATHHHPAVSTAFVTFSDPRDARRACRYLASHPDNPINCVVQMAPSFEDLDWTKIMKSSFKVEVSV